MNAATPDQVRCGKFVSKIYIVLAVESMYTLVEVNWEHGAYTWTVQVNPVGPKGSITWGKVNILKFQVKSFQC